MIQIVILWLLCGLDGFIRSVQYRYGIVYFWDVQALWQRSVVAASHPKEFCVMILGGPFTMIFTSDWWFRLITIREKRGSAVPR